MATPTVRLCKNYNIAIANLLAYISFLDVLSQTRLSIGSMGIMVIISIVKIFHNREAPFKAGITTVNER